MFVDSPGHADHCHLCALAADIAMLVTCPTNEPFRPKIVETRARWCPAFDNTEQQDAHHAFDALMNACDRVDAAALLRKNPQLFDFQNSLLRHTTPFNRIFGGLALVTTSCGACGFRSQAYEMVHAHSLSIADGRFDQIATLLIEHLGKDSCTDDQDLCHECLVHGRRTKETIIHHWPAVLVVSFKRFAFDRNTQQQQKIDRHIDFEEELPLGAGAATYHLRAVIMHEGTIAFGHYTAFVRSGLHNQWYFCNDAAMPRMVTDVKKQMLAAGNGRGQAYMLIYEQ